MTADRTQCPECHGHLKEPTRCRCGWVAPQEQLAQEIPGHVPCAADPGCRKPGRLWVDGLDHKKRICVDHYGMDPRRFKS